VASSLWDRVPRSWVVVGICAAVLLLYLAAIWYWLPSQGGVSVPPTSLPYGGTTDVVTDVDFIADFWNSNASDTSYLTTPACYDTFNPICPPGGGGYLITPDCPPAGCANVTPGGSFVFDLTMIDNDTISHEILNITMDPPFTLLGLSPATPYTLAPGVPTTFSIMIGMPLTPADYDLIGTVNTR
jgi:hypothetical protein